MTKRDVKDEMRDSDGDSHVEGRIRTLQREMAKRHMMQEVPMADVAISDQTRVAVTVRSNRLREDAAIFPESSIAVRDEGPNVPAAIPQRKGDTYDEMDVDAPPGHVLWHDRARSGRGGGQPARAGKAQCARACTGCRPGPEGSGSADRRWARRDAGGV